MLIIADSVYACTCVFVCVRAYVLMLGIELTVLSMFQCLHLVNLNHSNAVQHGFWNFPAKACIIWKLRSSWPLMLPCLIKRLLCWWRNLPGLGTSLLLRSVRKRVLLLPQPCSPWMQSFPQPGVLSFGEARSMAAPPAHSWNQLKVLRVSKSLWSLLIHHQRNNC